MALSTIMHGARAIIAVGTKKIGVFNSVSYSMNYDVSPAYILGRFSPGELVYTGAEVIQCQCSGFRTLQNGPHAFIPTLNELMTYDDITLTLCDRGNKDEIIMTISNVKPIGFSSQVSSRALQDMSITFQGLKYDDETTGKDGSESASSMSIGAAAPSV